MPILTREIDLYPQDLLDRPDLNSQPDRHWWALYTRSRREKDLMRRLVALDVPFYGPVIAQRTRSSSGRVRTSHVPLFAGYVFIHGDESQRYAALTTNCISRDIIVADGRELTDDLRRIRRLVDSGMPLTIESRLQPGTRVRVRTGVLADQEGIVIQRRGEQHLLVAVNFLQQGASVLLEDFEVEMLN
jgi:transcription antitermination factor NusG